MISSQLSSLIILRRFCPTLLLFCFVFILLLLGNGLAINVHRSRLRVRAIPCRHVGPERVQRTAAQLSRWVYACVLTLLTWTKLNDFQIAQCWRWDSPPLLSVCLSVCVRSRLDSTCMCCCGVFVYFEFSTIYLAGSTGHGRAWRRGDLDGWGSETGDYDDVLSGITDMVTKGEASATNVAHVGCVCHAYALRLLRCVNPSTWPPITVAL